MFWLEHDCEGVNALHRIVWTISNSERPLGIGPPYIHALRSILDQLLLPECHHFRRLRFLEFLSHLLLNYDLSRCFLIVDLLLLLFFA